MIPIRKMFGGFGNSLFQYAYILSQVKKGAIPDIYVQDEKYFENVKDEIRAMYGQGIKEIDRVSIHFRRGDYVGNPFYIDLTTTDYYQKAIAMFPNEKFLVFCADRQGGNDKADREWCMDWLQQQDVHGDFLLWEGENEIDDFNAMAGCKAHIMANSSFSWWTAYVGEGRMIAPKQWFASGTRLNYPSKWEVI